MITDVFHDKLLPGERIIWSGQPGHGIQFGARDIFLIPFSLMWGGFALFWEYTVLSQSNAPPIFRLWGIPFVLVGLFLIFGRFLLDAYIRARLFYAITDRRILILRTQPFPAFTSLNRDQLPALQLVAAPRNTGTLYFAPIPNLGGFGRAGWVPALEPTPKFIAIPNALDALQRLSAPVPSTDTLHPPILPPHMPATPATPLAHMFRNPARIAAFAVIPFVLAVMIWNTIACLGSGGANVHAVKSFATTMAAYTQAEGTHVEKFGPGDTIMALLVLTWPNPQSSAGTHRIVWNWYRNGQFVSRSNYCHMRFTDAPFTLRTWRAARTLGPGHIRVDTLIDGTLAGTTQFDITTQPSSNPQGFLPAQQSCGEVPA